MSLVEKIELPHTRLYLYPEGWEEKGFYYPVVYSGPCFGALKGRSMPFEVARVDFPYKKWVDHSKLPLEAYFAYVRQLAEWGFKHANFVKNSWCPNGYDATNGVYTVREPVHMLEWFSTYQVVRYTYENPRLVEWWYRMCQANPEHDKWLIFCMRHRIHPGHSLMSPRFTSIVNPNEVLAKIRSEKKEIGKWNPEWFKGKDAILFSYWGRDRVITDSDFRIAKSEAQLEENFQKEYEELIKLKESSK